MPPKMHSTAAFFSRLNFSINKIRRTFWDLNAPFKYQEHHTPWGVERRRIKMGRRKEVKDKDSRRRRRKKKGNQDQEMFL